MNSHQAAVNALEVQSVDFEADKTDYSNLVDNTGHNVKVSWDLTERLVGGRTIDSWNNQMELSLDTDAKRLLQNHFSCCYFILNILCCDWFERDR